MLLIAHRGLLEGPNLQLENNPCHVQQTLALGFDVEIDLHVKDRQLYLGHDYPQYSINQDFLMQPRLWIHAKNQQACDFLSSLQSMSARLNYFWHESDQRVLTSHGYWWTQPGCGLANWSIAVMPETVIPVEQLKSWLAKQSCVGVCSDHVSLFK